MAIRISPLLTAWQALKWINFSDYGAVADGTTDSTTALNNALSDLYTAGGGVLYVPPGGTFLVKGQIALPNNGASTPSQPALRIMGTAPSHNGEGGAPSGGSQIEFTYDGRTVTDGATTSGSSTLTSATANFTSADVGAFLFGAGIPDKAVIASVTSSTEVTMNLNATATATGVSVVISLPKITTYGLGFLEIDHLILSDNGSDQVPFFLTTNTTVKIHDCEFYGTFAPSNHQHAIVLGGWGDVTNGTAFAMFQGYGTVIRDNYFSRIGRGILGQTSCNGITIRDNTWWSTCGTDSAGGAIELTSNPDGSCVGNLVEGNLVEMTYYTYGIMCDSASECVFVGNSFYDPGSGTTSCYYFDASSTDNFVVDGYHVGITAMTDESNTATLLSGSTGSIIYQTMTLYGDLISEPLSGITARFLAGLRTWQADGVGGNMLIDSGTGGSYIDTKCFAQRVLNYSTGNADIIHGTGSTVLNGTTAGTATWTMPSRGGTYKKAMVYLNGYENTTATAQTIAFPTAFTNVPLISSQPTGFGATVSATTLTLPTSMTGAVTGWIVVEGF